MAKKTEEKQTESKICFDNDLYLKLQSENINKRIKKFHRVKGIGNAVRFPIPFCGVTVCNLNSEDRNRQMTKTACFLHFGQVQY